MSFAENLRRAREAMNLSQPDLAKRIGASQSLIGQIEAGDVKHTKYIFKLAKALNCSVHDLDPTIEADQQTSPRKPAKSSIDTHHQPEPFPGIRFGGIVEAGAFRPDTGMNQDNTYRYIAMAPDPRYPIDSQFAFQVMGDSMERAGIIEGMYVLGVDLYAWERLHGEPGDGKLVIVARTRDHHPERELTVKRLRIFRDRIELQPESGNPDHHPFVSKLPLSEDAMEWQIIAVILSASWLFT